MTIPTTWGVLAESKGDEQSHWRTMLGGTPCFLSSESDASALISRGSRMVIVGMSSKKFQTTLSCNPSANVRIF